MLRKIFIIVGILIIFLGLGWAGQGAGIINWPKSSFMVDSRPWITRGLVFAFIGLVVFLLASRRPRA